MEVKSQLVQGDARDLSFIDDKSVHLVLTYPPYWNLKEYECSENQLGLIDDYEEFLAELTKVWKEAFRILTPGGRLIVVVGDVLQSRKKHGRHHVLPLHSDIQVSARQIGFDNLSPIIWHKISNSNYESKGTGSFLGKPYEPNAIIKNDIEYILMLRKPGGYRSPSEDQRIKSKISKENFQKWFRQIWTDVPGANLKKHCAAYPEELASRLIQMFSFTEDIVVDPFVGSGTTLLAAMKSGRNSVGVDIEPSYIQLCKDRLQEYTMSTKDLPSHLVAEFTSRDNRTPKRRKLTKLRIE